MVFWLQAETRVTDNARLIVKLQQEVDRLEGKTLSITKLVKHTDSSNIESEVLV